MKKTILLMLAIIAMPVVNVIASSHMPRWQEEIISLISHKQFTQAGEKLKQHCINTRNADVCLILASAYFDGEKKFGFRQREIVKAYKYTRLACDFGSTDGCKASAAAIEKGELLHNVLFEPNVTNRDAQLKEAIQLGANLNATTLFTATLLQQAINEEKTEAVKLLLNNGVDVNYRVSDEDLTPLMYAINTGNKELVNLLMQHGANPDLTMQAPDYLKMDTEKANACDFARKLEKHDFLSLLRCKTS